MRPRRALLPLLLVGAGAPLGAEDGWTFQAAVGAVANLETSLAIRQDGFEDVDLDAEYETRPFETPLYYSLRAAWWRGGRGWELELVHHKLFLEDPPPEVQHFALSHGYNLVTVNRAWQRGGLVWRLGAGPVVAHPENQVRGRVREDSGYHLTGPVLQTGVEKRFELERRWFLGLEGKLTAARAEVPVAGGEAEVPNAAAHVLVGLGWGAER